LDLPVAGPLARSATDLKTALEVIGGPDGDAAKAYRWSLPAARGGRLKEYRIGFLVDDKLCPVTTEVGNVLSGLIEALRKSGSELKEGWPEDVIASEQYDTYRSMLVAFLAGEGPQEEPARASPPSADPSGHRAISKAARSASYRQYWAWNVQRMKARAIWQDFFRTFDVFLMPVAFLPAFPHDHRPWDERSHSTPLGSRPYEDLLFWISFATLTGLPATVAPVGVTSGGLPVGVQIVGPYLEDATPIQFAGLLADVAGGFRSPKEM
jgi:amidase